MSSGTLKSSLESYYCEACERSFSCCRNYNKHRKTISCKKNRRIRKRIGELEQQLTISAPRQYHCNDCLQIHDDDAVLAEGIALREDKIWSHFLAIWEQLGPDLHRYLLTWYRRGYHGVILLHDATMKRFKNPQRFRQWCQEHNFALSNSGAYLIERNVELLLKDGAIVLRGVELRQDLQYHGVLEYGVYAP